MALDEFDLACVSFAVAELHRCFTVECILDEHGGGIIKFTSCEVHD